MHVSYFVPRRKKELQKMLKYLRGCLEFIVCFRGKVFIVLRSLFARARRISH